MSVVRGGVLTPDQLIGRVSHYYSNLGVAGLSLAEPLSKGDRIHIVGHSYGSASPTDVEQTVDSMEIEHHQVADAVPGDAVAVKVSESIPRVTMSFGSID